MKQIRLIIEILAFLATVTTLTSLNSQRFNVLLSNFFAFNLLSLASLIYKEGVISEMIKRDSNKNNVLFQCNVSGFLDQISSFSSILCLAFISYRFAALSKRSKYFWILAIWIPTCILAVTATLQRTGAFILENNQCVKNVEDDNVLWASVASFKIFLSLLTLLLSVPSLISVYGNTSAHIQKHRHDVLHFMTLVVFDSLFTAVQSFLQLYLLHPIYKKAFDTISFTISTTRLLFDPILFLMLHQDVLKGLGFRSTPSQPTSTLNMRNSLSFNVAGKTSKSELDLFSSMSPQNSIEFIPRDNSKLLRYRSDSRTKLDRPNKEYANHTVNNMTFMDDSLRIALNIPHHSHSQHKKSQLNGSADF